MKITQELKAFALEQAGGRCECTGKDCRHHLRGSRCKRALRGNEWKVFWRKENGAADRKNIKAWCLACFANNFEVPRETVALLASDVVGYARLIEEDRWRAVTLRSALHDAALRVATKHNGRRILGRLEDDVLLEFATSLDAAEAARGLCSGFRELVLRLDLEIPELCGAIHCGEVTRWRNGILGGDTVEIARSVRGVAGVGRIVLTGPAAAPLWGKVEMDEIAQDVVMKLPRVGGIWALRL